MNKHHVIVDQDFRFLYPTSFEVNRLIPKYNSASEVQWSRYKQGTFAYGRNLVGDGFVLEGVVDCESTYGKLEKIVAFDSENELLLACEIRGIDVVRSNED